MSEALTEKRLEEIKARIYEPIEIHGEDIAEGYTPLKTADYLRLLYVNDKDATALVAEVERFQYAIKTWKKEEELWREAEANLYAKLDSIRKAAEPIVKKLDSAPRANVKHTREVATACPCPVTPAIDCSQYPKIEATRISVGAVLSYDEIRALAVALKDGSA